MPILVVGSVAFDTVKTPGGDRREVLGGSATHFSASASFFSTVRLVAVVGDDFNAEHRRPLEERGVDLEGLQQAPGRTFRWSGEYGEDLSDPRTLETQLNVFADFTPALPPGWAETPIVFLANIDPELQSRVLDLTLRPEVVAADTMNYWIDSKPDALKRNLSRVQVLFINESEIRQLTGLRNLVHAAKEARRLGPDVVVIKRGEHGVLVFTRDEETFALPAYPLDRVVDPTGAGDAFAGGFLGFLASRLARSRRDYRRAAVVGSVMASFQVEDFSLDRMKRLDLEEIQLRYAGFERLVRFGPFGE